tara:strand:- start:1404 stop:2438 length:1035 start_codon:yes stop_codon:yes gene_type:complete
MATQNNEEGEGEGGSGGIMSGLKKVGGGFVKAANLAQHVTRGAIQANPIITTAAGGAALYSKYRNYQDEKAGVPEEDRYPLYNPYGYHTAALRKGFDVVSGIVRNETGRGGAKEPSEFPEETEQLKALQANQEGSNGNPGIGAEDVGITRPYDPEFSGFDGSVNYSLTDGDSTDSMGLDMDEGVGAKQKYDTYGFKSNYEGDYANAEKEWDAIQSAYVDMHNGRGNIKLDSPEGQALDSRFNYIADMLDEANKRKIDAESATPGGGQSSTGSRTKDTASRPGYDAKNNRGITGALELSAIPHARSQEIQNGRIVLKGTVYNIVGNTGDKFLVPDPDQPDYSRRN